MRNCLIMGSGRSGTSMVPGVLSTQGYFMGDHLWAADEGNPKKGYFEDREVNGINEVLLSQVYPPKSAEFGQRGGFDPNPMSWYRWLARIPTSVAIPCPPLIATRIDALTARQPFCFKDPRFSYTLSCWRPYVRDAVFVCVFRHPGATAASILRECMRKPSLAALGMGIDDALEVWESMYRYVLERHLPQGGYWLFLHCNQVLDGSALVRLEAALGVKPDPGFIDVRLQRSSAIIKPTDSALRLYWRLCELAGYTEGPGSG